MLDIYDYLLGLRMYSRYCIRARVGNASSYCWRSDYLGNCLPVFEGAGGPG